MDRDEILIELIQTQQKLVNAVSAMAGFGFEIRALIGNADFQNLGAALRASRAALETAKSCGAFAAQSVAAE